MKSPIQITYEIVLRRDSPKDPFATRKGLLKALTKTRNPRTKEVVNYLLSNTQDGKKDKGYGSLFYVLYWLRDNVSELYEISARIAIEESIKSDWPLRNAIHFLSSTNMVGEYIQAMRGTDRADSYSDRLEWVEQSGLRIALNRSRRNLMMLSLRSGADLYIASSEEGGVIKARKGLWLNPVLTESMGPNWDQPYPDLVITKIPQDDPKLMLKYLNDKMVVQGRKEYGLQRHDLERNAARYQPGSPVSA